MFFTCFSHEEVIPRRVNKKSAFLQHAVILKMIKIPKVASEHFLGDVHEVPFKLSYQTTDKSTNRRAVFLNVLIPMPFCFDCFRKTIHSACLA